MIYIGGKNLSLDDFSGVVFNKEEIGLDDAAVKNVAVNHKFLQQFSSNKLIYGINTGFGPMAQYRVAEEHLLPLQYNLIRSHLHSAGSSGTV